MATRSEITRILQRVEIGDEAVVNHLFSLLYDELHGLAARHMQRERSGHTLGETGLVHEAYLRLVDQTKIEWRSRLHFRAVAARAMRQVLVDHARKRKAQKRGGGGPNLPLGEADAITEGPSVGHLALDEALSDLASFDKEAEQIVLLRYYGRMTNAEVAETLGVSRSTVDRTWNIARRWLHNRLHIGDSRADRESSDGR